ncbi:hypothetical protein OKW33_001726 [Paraburkholderia atlantica]
MQQVLNAVGPLAVRLHRLAHLDHALDLRGIVADQIDELVDAPIDVHPYRDRGREARIVGKHRAAQRDRLGQHRIENRRGLAQHLLAMYRPALGHRRVGLRLHDAGE